MYNVTPARVAKLGFLLFVPFEILRLLTGSPDPWLQSVIWLGQGLLLGAAAWVVFVGPSNVRMIYALCGLMCLMVPVWPWFTRLEVGPAILSEARIQTEGLAPGDVFKAGSLDQLTSFTLLNLVDAPVIAAAARFGGCAVMVPPGREEVILNRIDPVRHGAVAAVSALVSLLSLAGAAWGGYSLFRFAKPPDKVWVIIGAVGAAALALLLVTQSQMWQPCSEPDPARRTHHVIFWSSVILHPFGPMLFVVTLLAVVRWPRQFTGRISREQALRLSLRSPRRDGG